MMLCYYADESMDIPLHPKRCVQLDPANTMALADGKAEPDEPVPEDKDTEYNSEGTFVCEPMRVGARRFLIFASVLRRKN